MRAGHQQRSDRIRQVYGSDDLGVVTRGLRERRAAVLAGMVRAAVALVAPAHESVVRMRALLRSLVAPLN